MPHVVCVHVSSLYNATGGTRMKYKERKLHPHRDKRKTKLTWMSTIKLLNLQEYTESKGRA